MLSLQKDHNNEIVTATNYLMKSVIPEFAALFVCAVERAVDISLLNVSTLLHRNGFLLPFRLFVHGDTFFSGVNLRYLGKVIKCYSHEFGTHFDSRLILPFSLRSAHSSYSHSISIEIENLPHDSERREVLKAASLLLLIEATGRVIKNELNKLLRKQMKMLKLPLEVLFPCFPRGVSLIFHVQVPYRKVTIEYFNVIFGLKMETFSWWNERLPSLLRKYFSISSFPFQTKNADWRTEISLLPGKNGRELLFKKIGTLTSFDVSLVSLVTLCTFCE